MKVFGFELELGDRVDVGGLGIFPLTTSTTIDSPPYLTGPEAFEAGLIEVSELEPPQVPFLAIKNLADVPILLVEGEMLVGGDQNRTMNVTVLCAPGVRTVVPVSCVEAGRWGSRRHMTAPGSHAPGSLRAAKTANLEPRTDESSTRRSDQGRVWEEVERQALAHSIHSDTSALDDVQEDVRQRIAGQLSQVTSVAGQIGVICTTGDTVIGFDIFDHSSTLEKYLRGIVAGHALDALEPIRGTETIQAITRFLAQVDAADIETGAGVGLGDEILLHGPVAGVGLAYENRLIHVAAFPAPTDPG